MSEGLRTPYKSALAIAEYIVEQLRPACERIEIAGSLRRKKADVGDIELVCIPKPAENLLGDLYISDSGIMLALTKMGISWFMFKKNGQHFKQLIFQGISIDLFLTTPAQWGIIFMIRTGSADFSHRMVTPRSQNGLMPSNLHVKDGLLWEDDCCLQTPEEEDVFRIYGMNWIEPENRI